MGLLAVALQGLAVLIITTKGIENCLDTPGSSCIRPSASENRDIPFEDLGRGSSVPRFSSGTQVIASSYTFQCCGFVTSWRTYVDPGGQENGNYDIKFQVLRPSENFANNGCYSLVGANTFYAIILGSGGLVCETPNPGDEILVRPGDVVGFHAVHNEGGAKGIQIQDTYTDESVWYQVGATPTGDPQCVYSVGYGNTRTLQTFTNHAPILSVTLENSICEEPPTSLPATSLQVTSLQTTSESLQATSESLQATSDSLQATSDSLQATSDSLQATSDSLQATSDSLQATSESLHATVFLRANTTPPVDDGSGPNYVIITCIVVGSMVLQILIIAAVVISIFLLMKYYRHQKSEKYSTHRADSSEDPSRAGDTQHGRSMTYDQLCRVKATNPHYENVPNTGLINTDESHYVEPNTGLQNVDTEESGSHYYVEPNTDLLPEADSTQILVVPYAVTKLEHADLEMELQGKEMSSLDFRETINIAYNCAD